MNKRGLSNIIVTLLLIVLVLVAVSIVWGITKDLIESGVEEIDLGKFTLDLEIKSVKIEGDDVTVDVVVKRNPGPGEFIGMNFVFSDGQNSEVIREDTVLNELEERSFTYTLTKISTSKLEDVSIAPIYELSSGKENMGNIADKFNVEKTITAGVVTGEAISNFEKLGYSGAGKVEYGPFSSDTLKLPEFIKAIVDPLDVLPGDNQTFTVHVYSPHSVTKVTSTTELDNSTLDLDFEKVSEYEENSKTIEIWSISWIVNDVHTTTYRTAITATDSKGNENLIELTWTDSCQSQITHGGSSTLSTSCSTGASTVAGLDGGSLTVANGVTLTIDSGATWGFNSGQSITVDGTITINGEIKKTNLYYTDVDGDGYGSGTTLKTSSSNAIRAKDATGTGDCSDSVASIYQSVTGIASDEDQDGYTDTTAGSGCVGDSTIIGGRTYYDGRYDPNIWLLDSQKLGTNDCNDDDNTLFQVLNLGSDNDQDGYTDNMANVCVGSDIMISFRAYYKDATGFYSWLLPFYILGNDCDDSNAAILGLEWGAGVITAACCDDGSCPNENELTGVCSPVNSTNVYQGGPTGGSCGGGDEFVDYVLTQTCTC